MDKMIVVEKITKHYEQVKALSNISFTINKGELFGLVGPDGAGKSTLFRILATLLLPDKGKAWINGVDVVKHYKKIRSSIGYMPGRFSLYQDLSVEENLNFYASVFGTTLEENYALIEDIYRYLLPFKERKAGKLSGGMKQKLALCCALIHAPSILFLDEPTTGVDPTSRQEFWETLSKLKEKGMTILVSTPYMDEAVLCDRIALMQEGQLMKVDTPQQIIDQFDKALWKVSAKNMYGLLKDMRLSPLVEQCYTFGQYLHFTFVQEELDALVAYLKQKGHQEIEIAPTAVTIEDCYLQLTDV